MSLGSSPSHAHSINTCRSLEDSVASAVRTSSPSLPVASTAADADAECVAELNRSTSRRARAADR